MAMVDNDAIRERPGARFTSPAQLREWVQRELKLNVPARAVCPGHRSPLDYLWRAYHEPAEDLVVWAPRGGGKTRLGAVASLLDLLQKPDCAVRILGGSLEQSLRMWEHLWPDVLSFGDDLVRGRARTRRIQMVNGASAAVLTQSQRNVRGLRVQKLRCDEVEMFDPAVWQAAQLITRTLPKSKDRPELIKGTVEALSTCHRRSGLMQRVIEEAERRGVTVIKWCLLDVLEKCDPGRPCDDCAGRGMQGNRQDPLRGFLRDRRRHRHEEARQPRVLGIGDAVPPADGGALRLPAILDGYSRARDGRGDGRKRVVVGDGFWLLCALVCLWIRQVPGGAVHVIDEYVQPGRTMAEHIEQIRQRNWGAARLVACDPAGAARHEQTALSDVQLLKSAGFVVRHRSSRIQDSLELVRTAVCSGTGEVKLYIHPRCKRLIAAMHGYRYADGGSELPIKDGTHDHLMDALRYFFVNRKGCVLEGRAY